MLTHIWNQYLPVIRILLKRAHTADQTFNMNVADFERASIARKAGNRFSIVFSKGKAENMFHAAPLAKDFAAALLNDSVIKELFTENSYVITMNTKYQLTIHLNAKEKVE
ncbi:MAG TPA: hypothetical protein VM871_10895, partial [Flavisolibacter sp.]|nr:hypothetical protein [Flavisolibacter sp.]